MKFQGSKRSKLLRRCGRSMKAAATKHLAGWWPQRLLVVMLTKGQHKFEKFFSIFYHFEKTLRIPIINPIMKHFEDISPKTQYILSIILE
jgi:hypothetical protein